MSCGHGGESPSRTSNESSAVEDAPASPCETTLRRFDPQQDHRWVLTHVVHATGHQFNAVVKRYTRYAGLETSWWYRYAEPEKVAQHVNGRWDASNDDQRASYHWGRAREKGGVLLRRAWGKIETILFLGSHPSSQRSTTQEDAVVAPSQGIRKE